MRRRQPELRPPPGRAPGFPVPVLVSLPELKFQQYTAPSRNDEYLLHQTLQRAWSVGGADPTALDTFHARIQAYMLKAVREGKPHGSCINPNPAYEAAVARLVSALLERPEINPFLADFLPFQRRVARLGLLSGLTQTLLKLTVPGGPDLYRGTELGDLSLVDPDNRCPVDWEARARPLAVLTPV